jgi:hypothetical protein
MQGDRHLVEMALRTPTGRHGAALEVEPAIRRQEVDGAWTRQLDEG